MDGNQVSAHVRGNAAILKGMAEASGERGIAVIGHYNPDGDCVGSVMGMHIFLSRIGLKSVPILPNRYPSFLDFLDPEGRAVIYDSDRKRADRLIMDSAMVICSDFNSFGRTEHMTETLAGYREKHGAENIFFIDHHTGGYPEGCRHISTTEISSTCELMFYTLREMARPGRIPEEVLTPLATGVLTDTNNFNNSIFPSTFEAASEFISNGVDLGKINNEVFRSYSENRMRLMGYMLYERMTVLPEFGASYMLLSMQDKERFMFQTGDAEGLVNMPLGIKDIGISALFTEYEDNIRVSLRSKGDIPVNELSGMFFNGGGHRNASGGKLTIPLEDVPAYYRSSLERFLLKKGAAAGNEND